MIAEWFLFVAGAYLFGSLSFGKYIARRAARVDITHVGSGNIGATNVSREVGIKWGLLTLLLDALKGFLPVILYIQWSADHQALYDFRIFSVGCSAILGHQYSLFHRFSGGKGVATGLGVYLAISPLSCVPAVFVFLMVVYIWDFVSLGSIISSMVMPLFILYFERSPELALGAFLAAAFIVFKHRENIQRLLKKEEKKWRGQSRL